MSEPQTVESPPLPPSPTPAPHVKKFTHLSPAERITIQQLAAKGQNANQIALALDRDWECVKKAMLRGQDLLAGYPDRFVRHWLRASGIAAKKGDHGPARDALLYGKQIDPLEDHSAGTGVTVMVGYVPPGLGLSPTSQTLIGQAISVSDETEGRK